MDYEINAIEKMPASLDDRINVLLVYAGEKPATLIGGLGERYNPITECYETDEKKLIRCAELIEEVGLVYEIGNISMRGLFEKRGKKYLPSNENIPIFVARDKKTAVTIRKAGDASDERKFGRLVGYPETAIMAYMGDIPKSNSDIADRFGTRSPESFFTQFIFSEEFFHEEYKTSIRWHNTVKKFSPRLYKEMKEVYGL